MWIKDGHKPRYNAGLIFDHHFVSNPVFRFATVQGQNIHWFLKRNCSVTPVQLGWFYASLCAVSLGIATWALRGGPGDEGAVGVGTGLI